MKHVAMVVGAAVVLAAGFATAGLRPAVGGNEEKVTICHAAGLEGTTHYVTLTIGHEAVYGPAGHFFENGTPQAGHEQDYFGPCQGDTTSTETTTTTETNPCPSPPCLPNPQCTVNCNPPPPPPGPRCPPGMFPTNGKDGEPGNDECEFPPVVTQPPVVTTQPTETTTTSPAETTTAPEETTTVTPPSKPPVSSAAKPKPPKAQAKPKPKPHAKPKPPPVCPPGQPYNGKCGVQGSG